MRKKRAKHDDQTLELAAQEYRVCIMSSGDIKRADALLDGVIRPPCKALMRSYGIQWDNVLEQFLCTVLLHFSRFDGKTFISFFLYHARRNFDIPSVPLAEEGSAYGCASLRFFREVGMSQEEAKTIRKLDRQIDRRAKREKRSLIEPPEKA